MQTSDPSLRGSPSGLTRQSRFWIASRFALLAVAMTILMTPISILAEDKKPEASAPAAAQEKSATYAPDFCEFTVSFPAAPYTSQRCDDAGKQCYDQVSYTQVFDMASTVNFRVICNPVDESIIQNYTPEVMAATLRAMTNRSVVQTFDISQRDEKDYKQAGLVGEGRTGKMATIYIAQLWIGKHSALSVEAELIGKAAEPADKLFSDVLKSIGYRSDGKGVDDQTLPPEAESPATSTQPMSEINQSTKSKNE